MELPVDILKIDRSFAQQIPAHRGSTAVIASVLTLAHTLHKTLIAKGVEKTGSLTTLQELGCTYAQGYHLATPRPAEELSAQLTAPHRTS